jgi:hypothetical protein
MPHAIEALLSNSWTAVVADALRENGLESGHLVGRQRLAVVFGINRLERALQDVAGSYRIGWAAHYRSEYTLRYYGPESGVGDRLRVREVG